jgi:transcriptional regulator with XRE-family HTH domain
MEAAPKEWRLKLGHILKSYRKQNDLSQTALSVALDVSTAAISAWEKGMQYPSEENRKQIARQMNITYEKLEADIKGLPLQEQSISVEKVFEYLNQLPPHDQAKVLVWLSQRVAGFIFERIP